MRVALIAPKNTLDEQTWLGSFFSFSVEEYHPRQKYDAVIFWNLTPEIKRIRSRFNTLLCGIGVEPEWLWPYNYDPDLIQHLSFYSAYKNFADDCFCGTFHPFVYFAANAEKIHQSFTEALQKDRPYDFIQFARHDPNIRELIGECLKDRNAILAGPLFDNPVTDKLALQRNCRFELITENVINDWYMTEKLPEALMAGCVPVYLGCACVSKKVDPDLFVDLNRFGSPESPETVNAALDYCLAPGVYECFFENIRRAGADYIVERFSLENTVVRPIEEFLAPFFTDDFKARRSCFMKAERRIL